MNILKSKNLFFKILYPRDVSSRYVMWLNSKKKNQFLESRHSKQTILSCKKFVKNSLKNNNSYLFGIYLKKLNIHIGNIKLFVSHKKEKIGDIGIIIGEKKYQGKGYGVESIKRITSFGFKKIKLKRIQAGFYEPNKLGLKIFLKSGYTIDGTLKSYYIYKNKRVSRILTSILNK